MLAAHRRRSRMLASAPSRSKTKTAAVCGSTRRRLASSWGSWPPVCGSPVGRRASWVGLVGGGGQRLQWGPASILAQHPGLSCQHSAPGGSPRAACLAPLPGPPSAPGSFVFVLSCFTPHQPALKRPPKLASLLFHWGPPQQAPAPAEEEAMSVPIPVGRSWGTSPSSSVPLGASPVATSSGKRPGAHSAKQWYRRLAYDTSLNPGEWTVRAGGRRRSTAPGRVVAQQSRRNQG